jgi:hypothetical protein
VNEADRISPGDLLIHKRMIERYQEALRLAARAQQLVAGTAIWVEDLHERYGLTEADAVLEDGTIFRATS